MSKKSILKATRREKATRRANAYHEAGHAVVLTLVGIPVDYLSLEIQTRDDGFGDAQGTTKLKTDDDEETNILDYLASLMAGIVAVRWLGYPEWIANSGGVADYNALRRIALEHLGAETEKDVSDFIGQGQNKAAELLACPGVWDAVVEVGETLLKQGRMDGSSVLSIVRARTSPDLLGLVNGRNHPKEAEELKEDLVRLSV